MPKAPSHTGNEADIRIAMINTRRANPIVPKTRLADEIKIFWFYGIGDTGFFTPNQYALGLFAAPANTPDIDETITHYIQSPISSGSFYLDETPNFHISEIEATIEKVYFCNYNDNKISLHLWNNFFYNFTALKEIDWGFNQHNNPMIDTSDAFSFKGMFYGCVSLEKLDLTSFNTSKVQDTAFMFANCHNLKSIKVNQSWSAANIYSAFKMFGGDTKLRNFNGIDDNTHAVIDDGLNGGYLDGESEKYIHSDSVQQIKLEVTNEETGEQTETTLYIKSTVTPDLKPIIVLEHQTEKIEDEDNIYGLHFEEKKEN